MKLPISFLASKFFPSPVEKSLRLVTLLYLLVAVAIITGSVFYYRNSNGKSNIQLYLLPGNHTVVPKVLNGDVLVNQDQFQKASAGKQTFVSRIGTTVSYYVKVDGVGYRFDSTIGGGSWEARNADLTYNQLQKGGLINTTFNNGKLFATIGISIVGLVIVGIPFLLFFLALEAVLRDQKKIDHSTNLI